MTRTERNECLGIIAAFRAVGAFIVVYPTFADVLRREGLWADDVHILMSQVPRGERR